MKHTHEIKHWPNTVSGEGWGVCECGATIRVEKGGAFGKFAKWHACKLCSTAEPTERRA